MRFRLRTLMIVLAILPPLYGAIVPALVELICQKPADTVSRRVSPLTPYFAHTGPRRVRRYEPGPNVPFHDPRLAVVDGSVCRDHLRLQRSAQNETENRCL